MPASGTPHRCDVLIIGWGLAGLVAAGEAADLSMGAKEIASVDQLARNCMKTEVNLAEICNRNAGIVRGGYAMDMDAARVEIGCRLGRLRACRPQG